MIAADEAEARGDAAAALAIIESNPLGPDGEFFWRPWRVRSLQQLVLQQSALPGWVVSRWILAQSIQVLHHGSRARSTRALRIALDLRGGEQALEGRDEVDAACRVMDRDWVYRQVFAYELGGLAAFVRSGAAADLIVGADSIREWARVDGWLPAPGVPARRGALAGPGGR